MARCLRKAGATVCSEASTLTGIEPRWVHIRKFQLKTLILRAGWRFATSLYLTPLEVTKNQALRAPISVFIQFSDQCPVQASRSMLVTIGGIGGKWQ